MFKIGDKIVNKNGKVCEIVSIEDQDYGVGVKTYYVLSPCFTKNESLRMYTPVEQESSLRRIMSKEEVDALLLEIPNIEPIWILNPKVRKTKFKELYSSGNPIEIFRLIKSFLKKKEDYKLEKKTLSFTDENFLKEIRTNIYNEIAVVLNISLEEAIKFIDEKLGYFE